jgi:hypothetical protein
MYCSHNHKNGDVLLTLFHTLVSYHFFFQWYISKTWLTQSYILIFTFRILLRIYKQTMLPILDYGSNVWHECGTIQTRRVEEPQKRAFRIILHQGRRKCSQEMRMSELKLLTLHSRRRFLRFTSIFKILYNLDCPSQLRYVHIQTLHACTTETWGIRRCLIFRSINIQVWWCKRLPELFTIKH